MTKLMGYLFLLLGIALLVVGLNQLGVYVKSPDQFPIYRMLVSLPEADRTISLQQGAMVLPVGFFKISGMLSIILTGFLFISVIKLLITTGLGMIKADTRDLARQLISEIRKLEHKDIGG
ncbi:MAG: hypothetical protein CMK89_19470 [Pseudomonadales bacterium]|nr:hypothetical protein [Pseudomonadales bacterium]